MIIKHTEIPTPPARGDDAKSQYTDCVYACVSMCGVVNTLPNHNVKWNKNTLKYIMDKFFVCTKGYIFFFFFFFLQLLLCCKETLLEKYPVWQLTMLYSSVVKQIFSNTNVVVNKNAFQSKDHLWLANRKSNTYNFTWTDLDLGMTLTSFITLTSDKSN